MFNHKHYVPILKGKRGDFWALRNLKALSREFVTPLIEVVPPSERMTEELRLIQTARMIDEAWPHRHCFVDLIWREDAPLLSNGDHVVDGFFKYARSRSPNVIPVTALTRTPAYQQATRRVAKEDNRGLALRLSVNDFNDMSLLTRGIDGLLAFSGLTTSDIHVLIDFGSVGKMAAGLLAQAIRIAIDVLPYRAEWRTLTVAAGSFPESVSTLPQSTWTTLSRTEWAAWNSAISSGLPPGRLPTYGDYAVGDPKVPFSGQSTVVANLRYSEGGNFFVWHGMALKTHERGNKQIFDICSDLVGRPEFSGLEFSSGDSEIYVKSASSGSPGNPQQWRQWATNHYLELVVSQVANLP